MKKLLLALLLTACAKDPSQTTTLVQPLGPQLTPGSYLICGENMVSYDGILIEINDKGDSIQISNGEHSICYALIGTCCNFIVENGIPTETGYN